MAMTKRPLAKAADPAAFIEQAPDTKPARWQRGSKTQITLSLAPELLERIDLVAKRQFLSRAAVLTRACTELLKREEDA